MDNLPGLYENEEDYLPSLVHLRLISRSSRLVDTRKALGLTGATMAQRLGIVRSRLSKIENLHCVPSEEEMVRFASVLGQTVEFLFPEEVILAIRTGVFDQRTRELPGPVILSLAEARKELEAMAEYTEEEPMSEADMCFLKENIEWALSTLAFREARVLRLRFGLDDGKSRTLEEVSKEFGTTRERIRQIEAKALRKLRHPLRSRRLEGFVR